MYDTNLVLGGKDFSSRLIVGTGKYPTNDIMRTAIEESGAEIVTVAIRRVALSDRVAASMGKALKPERVLFARDLPKTRSAKIMRRVIRATYLGREPGDLSSLENPDAVKAVAEAT